MQAPVQFAKETLTPAVWDEAVPLLFAHWKEIAHYPDIALAPDMEAYAASEAAGILRLYTARAQGDGPYDRATAFGPPLLLGYALFFLRPNPHYRGSVQAVSDVIYLAPSMRGINGWKFLKYIDAELTKEGAEIAYHHVKLAHDFGPILKRMGYEAVEVIYTKRLHAPAAVEVAI